MEKSDLYHSELNLPALFIAIPTLQSLLDSFPFCLTLMVHDRQEHMQNDIRSDYSGRKNRKHTK